jgi:hypothetical protein
MASQENTSQVAALFRANESYSRIKQYLQAGPSEKQTHLGMGGEVWDSVYGLVAELSKQVQPPLSSEELTQVTALLMQELGS